MNSALTLVCPKIVYAEVLKVTGRIDAVRKIKGGTPAWKSIALSYDDESVLTLNSLIRRRPGDEFSRTVLGMHTYFYRSRPTKYEKILDKIVHCKMFIGITYTQSLDEKRIGEILAIAKKLNALIFNGNALLGADGKILLRKKRL